MNALAAVATPSSSPSSGELGIVRRFLAWAPRACVEDRAEAVNALARAYLYSDLSSAVRSEALVALTSVLDDSSALVRGALAHALASAAQAPRHLVLALAGDQSEVSRVVLALSPVLTDAELVDCAAIGDVIAQTAIARRPRLSASVAAALAEVGESAAAMALLDNHEAVLGAGVPRRIFDRFGGDPAMRETLLGRADIPASLRAEIAAASAASLAAFASDCRWLHPQRADRIARDAREQTFIAIARQCSEPELADLVAWLRKNDALTVALLMRALMSGDLDLLRQSLVDMSGVPSRRVAGFLRDARGQGFASVYAKAGLPAHFLPAFRAAIGALAAESIPSGDQISHALTSRLIRACENMANPALAPVLAMLWRFAGESAREEAREFAAEALTPVLDWRQAEPAGIEDKAPILTLNAPDANENFAPDVELDLAPVGTLADAA